MPQSILKFPLSYTKISVVLAKKYSQNKRFVNIRPVDNVNKSVNNSNQLVSGVDKNNACKRFYRLYVNPKVIHKAIALLIYKQGIINKSLINCDDDLDYQRLAKHSLQ